MRIPEKESAGHDTIPAKRYKEVLPSMVNVMPVQLGKTTRMSFGKIDEVLKMPNLIEVQKNSYKWFLEEGLKEVFRDVSAITDYNGNLVLNFVDYRIDDNPKYTVAECKERDVTYAAPLRVKATLWNKETGDVKENEVFMGDFPLMTESGTFVINGAERVIVSQLVRSPGVYYAFEKDKTGKDLFKTTVIPNRGAWLEYEMDSNDVIYVRIDKNRKIPVTVFIRALIGLEATKHEGGRNGLEQFRLVNVIVLLDRNFKLIPKFSCAGEQPAIGEVHNRPEFHKAIFYRGSTHGNLDGCFHGT